MDAVLGIYELVVWLPRGVRDSEAEGPTLFLIKPTTPYLLNKHHLMVIAHIYWVLPMSHTRCEVLPVHSVT